MRTEVEYKVSFSFLEPFVLSAQSLDNDSNLDTRVNLEIETTDTCNDKLAPGFEINANDPSVKLECFNTDRVAFRS